MKTDLSLEQAGLIPFKFHEQLLIVFIAALLTGCVPVKKSTDYLFNEGVYSVRTNKAKPVKSYVIVTGDSIRVIPVSDSGKDLNADTPNLQQQTAYSMADEQQQNFSGKLSFYQKSIDLDLLSVFFKYRPAVSGIPNQLNTDFNGAFYIGYRKDRYQLKTVKTPLNIYRKKITHYAYSFGFFSGIGETQMNSSVTGNMVDLEYNGVIFTNSLCANIGIHQFTFGLALGIDKLLDKNSKVWIYQDQPWLGLTLHLELNQ